MSVRAAPRRAGLRVAMALYGDLTHDSRVIREAESLAAAGHAITIACLDASSATIDRLQPSVNVVVRRPPGAAVRPGDPSPFFAERSPRVRATIDRARWLLRYRQSLARWGRQISDAVGPVDVWHAHDLTGLEAVAPNVSRHMSIVYDSHELFLEMGSALHLPRLARRLLQAHEARLVGRCAAVITVNPGVAAVLGQLYRPARIEVVRNCPPRWPPPAKRPNLIRVKCGLTDDAPIALFHGGLDPDRGIEQLIAALTAPGLEDLHLVLLGYGELREGLEIRAADPHLSGRLHVLAAVDPAELPQWVASADVGAVLIQPTNRNLLLSTPNKLFEAIAVGTPVVASDLPEIARVVRDDPDGPLGILCDPGNVEAIVAALRSLLDPPRARLLDIRTRCLRAAESRLNWEVEVSHLLDLYSDLGAVRRSDGIRDS